MRKIQIVLVFTACLFFVTSTVTAQKAKNTMTNADVIEMVKAGLSESTIVLAIQQSEPNFDTSTKALIELSKQGVSQKVLDVMLQTPATKPESSKRTEPTNAIAYKDIGSLRIVLRSILPVKIDTFSTMRCNFEFINLETQKPIVVAMNSNKPDDRHTIGGYLRSTLVDENGGVLTLRNDYVTGGLGKIGVGSQPSGNYYDTADIITVLSKRDDLKSDVTSNQSSPFIFGSMTEISPEQSVAVSMTFFQNDRNSTAPMKVFQLATEIVVGSVTSGSKKSYTNLKQE